MRNRIRRVLRAVMAAQQSSARPTPPVRQSTRVTVIAAEGVIQQVDPIGRELPMVVDGVTMNFYVPIQCMISLNDERVKLRLLQPQDRARLEYSIEHGVSTAHSITVQCCDAAPLEMFSSNGCLKAPSERLGPRRSTTT